MLELKNWSAFFNESMLHNVQYVTSPSQAITQGNSNVTRVGDEVYLQSLEINGIFLSSSAANAAQKYRMMVVFHSNEDSCGTSVISNAITGTNLFHANTNNIIVNGIINPKAVTVLADFIVDLNCNVSGAREVKSFAFKVPINETFKYGRPGDVFGKNKNLYIIYSSFISGGTTGATSTGNIEFSSVLKFKDS